jgi:hypothetical protein
MLVSQHDSADPPQSPVSALAAPSGGAPRPRTLLFGGTIVTLGVLAGGGIDGLMVVATLAFIAAAIPLAHVMFGLPPAIQHEPDSVAHPTLVG